MTTPICLWSGPRNVSTALMYSFAQRDDIRIIDEPLYGHYLRVSGADHPGGQDVMGAMNCDGDAVMRELVDQQALDSTKRLFIKHMAHHLVGLDLGFVRQTCNLFLIRDPKEMLPLFSIRESCCSTPKVSSGSFAITLATYSQRTCCNGRPGRAQRMAYGRLTGTMPCIKARGLRRIDQSLISPHTSSRFWWNASRGMTCYSNRRFAPQTPEINHEIARPAKQGHRGLRC